MWALLVVGDLADLSRASRLMRRADHGLLRLLLGQTYHVLEVVRLSGVGHHGGPHRLAETQLLLLRLGNLATHSIVGLKVYQISGREVHVLHILILLLVILHIHW